MCSKINQNVPIKYTKYISEHFRRFKKNLKQFKIKFVLDTFHKVQFINTNPKFNFSPAVSKSIKWDRLILF